MKARQKKIIAFLAILIILISSVLIWYIIEGRELAHKTLSNYLQTRLNNTLEIQSFSVSFNGISVKKVYLELTPQMTLTLQEVFIRLSVFRLLSSGLEMSGAVKEISLFSPLLSISERVETDSKSGRFNYRPYPLKPFSELKFIRRITIHNAGVSAGENNIILADSIHGRFDLTDITNVNLSMIGGINAIPNARVEVDGTLNLKEGSFLLVSKAITDDISSWKLKDEDDRMKIEGGSARVVLEARGSDVLRISGVVETDSLAFSVGDRIQVRNGFIRGELFGSSLGMQGIFKLNNVELPFTADIPDILKLKWKTEIAAADVDLSKLDNKLSGLPKISGFFNLNSVFNGQGSIWYGLISANSSNLLVEETEIDDIDFQALIDSVGLEVNNLNAVVYGGELSSKGMLSFKDDGSMVDVIFNREWIGEEAKTVFNDDSLRLELNGRFEQSKRKWSGKGRGKLIEGNGSELLTGTLKLENRRLSSQIISPDEEGWLGLSVSRESGLFNYQLSTHEPQYALKRVLNQKFLPKFLHDYSINFDLDGNGKQFKIDLRWEYKDGIRGGLYQADVYKQSDRWKSAGTIRLLLDNGSTLKGWSELDLSDNYLFIKDIALNDDNDKQILMGSIEYSPIESKTFETNIITHELPAASLIRFIKPDFAVGCNSAVDINIEGTNDSLTWRSKLFLNYSDGLRLSGGIDGSFIKQNLSFDKFELVNEFESKDIFTFEGEVDLGEDSLKSVVIRAVDFPIGRILDIINTDISKRIDGRLNGRIEMEGSLKHPEITSDVRLSNAVIQGNSSYWMNLRSVTKDNLYILEQLDLGRDVLKLINVTGNIDRYDTTYDLRLNADDVDISAVIQLLSGKPGPLTGKSNISIRLRNDDFERVLRTNLMVYSGQITPILLNFDTLTSNFDITNFGKDSTLLTLNNLDLDMDDSKGYFSGTIGLQKNGKINVNGDLKGNLLGLLPRIDKFFSRTSGYGEIDCKIGGDILNPRIMNARLKLTEGSMRLNDVVERIDNLNVDIELDSAGQVTFQQFSGKGNGTPFTFTNRRHLDLEQPIIIGDYNFGILGFRTNKEGIFAIIPSFMRDEWGGNIRFSGFNEKGDFEFQGPAEHPIGIGEIRLTNATFTYPFLTTGKKSPKAVVVILDVLKRMRWDAYLIPWQGCTYSREVSGLTGVTDLNNEFLDLDLKLYADLMVDDNPEGLHFTGSLDDTLKIRGQLTSTRGKVEYLDLSFDVNELGVIFNPVELQPIFYGGMSTEVIDSLGIHHSIRWVVRKKADELDRVTGTTQSTIQDRGRWSEITLVLEDDDGNSQEQILALLGYSPEGMPGKLAGLGSKLVTDITPLRRWEKDLERQVERWLGVDRVDITSTVASNIVERQISRPDRGIDGVEENYSYLRTLDHSRVSVGKYVFKGVFVSYTGSLLSETDVFDVTRLGIVHDWDLMLRLYQIAPNLTLNYRYQYDSLSQDQDNRIFLRFSYIFSLQDFMRKGLFRR
ncbi:translocation/assembly module TamB [bacterium]|nr:translocation/assembly module TamB [bacterium]